MSWKQVILIVCTLATVVLLYILPTPNANYRNIEINNETEKSEELSSDEKIEKALKIIQSGKAPMQAIQLLKEVEKNDPNNEKVLFYLGDFSLKTGQFEKAIPRFEKLTSLVPKSPQYWYLLGQTYELAKKSEKAISAYKTFINFDTDSIIIEDVKTRIKELK